MPKSHYIFQGGGGVGKGKINAFYAHGKFKVFKEKISTIYG